MCKPVASSMKRSEQSGWVLRRVSLTQRDRLTPVFVQDSLTRISNLFAIRHLLVMRLTCIGRTQIADSLGLRIDDEHILVTVHLLLATVMKGLFFRLFRSLAASLCAINDVIRWLPLAAFRPSKFLPFSFRHNPYRRQRISEYRQQAMQPLVRTRLTHLKQLAHHDLKRIGFLIHQDEQQLLLCPLQVAFASTAQVSFARPSRQRFVAFISAPIRLQQTQATRLGTLGVSTQ